MAGTFMIGETKVRPGAYFNRGKKGDGSTSGAVNGITGALFQAKWGPLNEAVELSAEESYEDVFGNEKTTDTIGLVFEGGAKTCVACRIGNGGAKASVTLNNSDDEEKEAVKITANYEGSMAFSVTVRDALSDSTQRECIIYAGTREFEKVSFAKGEDEVSALVDAFSTSKNFTASKVGEATGTMKAVNQSAMSGGQDPQVTNADYSKGLQVLEAFYLNTICVDTENTEVHGLLQAYINRVYEVGQLCVGVVAEKTSVSLDERMSHAAAFNAENMVYVLNSKADSAAYGEVEGYQTAAKIAGMYAACESNIDLTHMILNGCTKLKEVLTNTQMIKAEQMGCLVLSLNREKQVWIDNAINTLVSLPSDKDEGWKKIRRTKTRYEAITRMNDKADELVGKVDNDKNGRATVISQLQNIGDQMIQEGKLTSCVVTESAKYIADGDSCWFDIDIVDKDSATHIYLFYQFRFSTNV